MPPRISNWTYHANGVKLMRAPFVTVLNESSGGRGGALPHKKDMGAIRTFQVRVKKWCWHRSTVRASAVSELVPLRGDKKFQATPTKLDLGTPKGALPSLVIWKSLLGTSPFTWCCSFKCQNWGQSLRAPKAMGTRNSHHIVIR